MTAGVLWLGLKLLGVDKVGIYDEVSVSDATNGINDSSVKCCSPGLDMLPVHGVLLKNHHFDTPQ